MVKTVLRVYDKNEEYTNTGECYFLIMPDRYESEWEKEEELEARLVQITSMGWQNYTSYMIGTADIEEKEMFWSEVTHYSRMECKIDINRVKITERYGLPEYMIQQYEYAF